MTAEPKGWGQPLLARRAHYFVGARSLCGGWAYTGNLEPADPSDFDRKVAPRTDCKTCWLRARRVHKRKE